MQFLLPALALLGIFTLVSLVIKEKAEVLKYILFGGMVLVVLGYTGYLIWSTISINQESVTKGPVHYHADFQIWNCGRQIDIIDPAGWENKVGTPLFHEHNDNRIHVEGPVLDYQEITLGKFFEVIGGKFTAGSLMVPVTGGVENLEDGTACNGEAGQFQVFAYKTQGKTFHQEKLVNPENYVLSPHSQVPPGDCIIIELDRPKEKTDKICTFYQVAIQKGEIIQAN